MVMKLYLIAYILVALYLSSSNASASSTNRRANSRKNEKEKPTQQTGSQTKPNLHSNTKRKPATVGGDLPKNFYDRLGVTPKANEKEIKKAYRKLAIKVSKSFTELTYDEFSFNNLL
jgi:DnaJ-class molecular chaperone